jgi:hypothetical protein
VLSQMGDATNKGSYGTKVQITTSGMANDLVTDSVLLGSKREGSKRSLGELLQRSCGDV